MGAIVDDNCVVYCDVAKWKSVGDEDERRPIDNNGPCGKCYNDDVTDEVYLAHISACVFAQFCHLEVV